MRNKWIYIRLLAVLLPIFLGALYFLGFYAIVQIIGALLVIMFCVTVIVFLVTFPSG